MSRFALSGKLTKVKRRQKRVYLNQYWTNKNVQFLVMMQKNVVDCEVLMAVPEVYGTLKSVKNDTFFIKEVNE